MNVQTITGPLLATVLLGLGSISCTSTHAASDAARSDGAVSESDASSHASRPLSSDGIFYVVGEDPKRPFVRYRDGQVSLSNSCAIKLENKLNRHIPPAHVNGQPIGFC